VLITDSDEQVLDVVQMNLCKKVETEECGSVIRIGLHGRGYNVLLDTGATVCVISHKMYKKTGCAKENKIVECSVKKVLGVGGKETTVLGATTLPIKIEGLLLYQQFLVIPGSNKPEIIIGENFLKEQKAILDYETGVLTLQGGLVSCKTMPTKCLHERVSLVRTTTELIIDGKSECIIPVKVSKRKNQILSMGIIDPTVKLANKFQVAGAKCAVTPDNQAKCSFRLLNPMSKTTTIPRNTVVGVYSEIASNSVKLVHTSDLPVEFCNAELDDDTYVGIREIFACTEENVTDDIDTKTDIEYVNVAQDDSLSYIDRLFSYSSSYDTDCPTVCTASTQDTDRQTYIDIGKDLGVNVATDILTESEQEELLELVGRNRDIFATDISELGCYKGYQLKIDTGDATPVKSRFYRASPEQKREIERQVKELLDHGIISRSTSDWLSPVILVRKPNNTWRMCVDYRGLNKLVKPIYFPLPRHSDVVDTLGESKASIFSTLDLAQAFFQTELDPATKHRSAFIVSNGVYEWNRVPFGLSNSPASFGIVMSQVLRDFLYVFALVYADDILLYSPDYSSHKKHLSTVFDQLRKCGLTLKPTKCTLGAANVKFLGHVFSKAGVAVDPDKTKAIRTFPTPENATQVKAFLGLCQYYRKFCKKFSHICSPLTALLRKDAKFVWDSHCEEAFQKLKDMLCSSPVLALPCFDREFILYTDASGSAISYILGQRDEKGREVVIEYGGRSLRKNERNWGITELEGLAMIEGIRQYNIYLCDRPFTLVTDHAALQYIQSTKSTTGRLSRWALFLQQYRMKVEYKQGKLHLNADSLSRREYPPTESPPSMWVAAAGTKSDTTAMTVSDVDNLTVDSLAQVLTVNALSDDKSKAENRYMSLNAVRHLETTMNIQTTSVKDQQRSDKDLIQIIDYLGEGVLPDKLSEKETRKFIAESHDYVLDSDDELLYHLYCPRGKGPRANRILKQLVVPETLKHDILLNYHDSLLIGHGGFDRTYHLIRLKYFWKRMYNEIGQYVKSCQDCQKNKAHGNKPGELKPLPCEGIFKRVHLDLFGPLPEVDGYKYVLLIVDSFSKWTEAFPVKSLRGDEIAKIFYREYICRWGAPYSLLSDRGTNFLSKVVTETCKLFDIDKYKTTSWHPQTNATAERRMATLAQTLRMFCDKNQKNWPDLLPSIMAGWRATPSCYSTMFSPYRLLMGEEMRLPIDVTLLPDKNLPADVFKHLEDLAAEFKVTHDIAKENIKKAQEKQKEQHDKKAIKPTYKLGDLVWITNVGKEKGLNPKLQPKYVGPYYIADVGDNNTYEVRDRTTHRPMKSRINVQRLKSYVPESTRDISLNEYRDTEAAPASDELDDLTAQDTGPLTDRPTDTVTDAVASSQSNTGNANETQVKTPSQTQSNSVDGSQVNSNDSNTQTNPGRVPESLWRCQSYKGQKWYLTKWKDHKFRSWVIERNLPEDLVRKFHIEKTQSGKSKKSKKRPVTKRK
jgi:predicted aspartyl protease